MIKQKKVVAVVEDEEDLCNMVCRTLEEFHFTTQAFYTGEAARDSFATNQPDICIIDLMLPDMDGLELVREMSQYPGTGVIVLTARGDSSDRILGLEVGADDYVVKPFEPRELVARVHSLLRRIERLIAAYADTESRMVTFAGWTYDVGAMVLRGKNNHEMMLSAAEALLLLKFLRAPKRVLSREKLFDEGIASDHQPFDRSIDIRISRLRRKIENDCKDPQIIKTVYGAGYLFATDVVWQK